MAIEKDRETNTDNAKEAKQYEMKNTEKTNRFEVYVGLNDSDTKEQKFSTEKYERIISDVCCGYNVAYSISLMSGGYIHENGVRVKENSLRITLIGITDVQAEEISKDICAFFHQESVLIIKTEVECTYLSERIDF